MEQESEDSMVYNAMVVLTQRYGYEQWELGDKGKSTGEVYM